MENIDINKNIDKDIFENIDIGININKDNLKNVDIDIDINMVILENIDIDIDIDMDFLEYIDIDKGILQNIDIDKIFYRLEFGISNRAKNARLITILHRERGGRGGVSRHPNVIT